MKRALLTALLVVLLPMPTGAVSIARPSPHDSCGLPEPLAPIVWTWMDALQRGDFSAARIARGTLAEKVRALKMRNLFGVSAALRNWVQTEGAGVPSSDLLEVLDGAIEIAPDDPWLWKERGLTLLRQGIPGIPDALSSFQESLRVLLFDNPRAALTIGGLLAFQAMLATTLCLLLVSLGIFLRHFHQIAHDLGDLFPRSSATPFSMVETTRSRRLRWLVNSGLQDILPASLLVVLVLLPLFAGFGLLFSVLLWTILLLPYLRPAERFGAAASLMAMTMLPLLAAWTLLPGRALEGDGALLWTALRAVPPPGTEERLAIRSEQMPQDPWAPLVRSEMDLRKTPLSPGVLQAHWKRLSSVQRDAGGVIATAIGHLSLRRSLAGCHDEVPDRTEAVRAREEYRGALRQVPNLREALEGLLFSSALLGESEEVAATMQRLVSVTPDEEMERVAGLKRFLSPQDACRDALGIHRALRLPSIPHWPLYLSGMDLLQPADRIPFQQVLWGRLHLRWLPVLSILGLLVLILVTGIRGRLHFASRCPRCGHVSCSSCNQAATGFDYCPECLFEQVRPAFLDPTDWNLLRERRRALPRAGRSILAGIAFLVPGFGQVMDGRPIRGVLFLWVLCLSILAVALPASPIVDPLLFSGVPRGLSIVPPLALLAVFLLSALDLWRNRRT